MKEFFSQSVFFGVLLCIGTYQLVVWIRQKTKLSLLNPLLISIILVILFLLVFRIDYDDFYQGGKYLSYLLTPATVVLAVPLYARMQLLKDNFKAVMAGIVSGVITSLVSILVLALLFGLSHTHYVTLLPKSITTAIGIGVSDDLGGIPTITTAVIIVTGVFGNVTAEWIYKLFRITEPIAKGVGLGSSAHAMGTARAMEMGETEGAMSSLSIAVSGLFTVIGASIFASFL